jgi:hypothetical protein
LQASPLAAVVVERVAWVMGNTSLLMKFGRLFNRLNT